jgi:RNA-directed DNA polymerase
VDVLTKTKTQEISKKQVWDAWNHVKKGGKGMGIDQVGVEKIEMNLQKYLYPLWNRLASGSYVPPPVKEVSIPKGDGTLRKLGIPTILDRVAQQVIRAELEPIVEPKFHSSSFGYRPKRSAHDALEQCVKNCSTRWYVVDLDIKGFFDNIDHANMIKVLRRHTDKKHILLYCERWLKANVYRENGEMEAREKGTPQGGVISPLLANIYLHEVFDKWMAEIFPSVPFERYADDIVVHATSAKQAEFLMESVRKRLALGSLELSKEKSKIVYCVRNARSTLDINTYTNSFDFLGYTFKPRCCKAKDGRLFSGFGPGMSKKKQQSAIAKLRELAVQQWTNKTLVDIADELAPILRGWINYFGRFRPIEMTCVFSNLNARLAKWANKKFKLRSPARGYYWVMREWEKNPCLFVHWKEGFKFGCLSRRAV